MPDLIRFSDLKDSHPLTLDGNNDLFAIAVKNPSSETGYTSQTVLPNQVAGYVAEDATYVNLKTGASDNTVVKAINKTLENFADEFNTTAGSTYAKDDCVIYDGVLYQCSNASGTTSGTFITADWTQVRAVDVGSGGGGGSSTLAGLADVAITSPTNNQVLKYNATSQKWVNGQGSSDVNIIKSATGNPCTFDTDIAIPLKSLSADIVATQASGTPTLSNPLPISGISSLEIVRCGKNLFDKTGTDTTNGYVANSYLRINNTTTPDSDLNVSEYISIGGGVPITITSLQYYNPSICFYDSEKNFISGEIYNGRSVVTITTPNNAAYLRFSIIKANIDTTQIELGSTATEYEPYNGQTITIDLGGTRYGGVYTADGKLRVTHGVIDLDTLSWNTGWYSSEPPLGRIYARLNGKKAGRDNLQCEIYPLAFASDSYMNDVTITGNAGSDFIYIRDTNYDTGADLVASLSGYKLVYELATPIEIDVSSISVEAVSGVNNITSNGGGDIAVEYYTGIAGDIKDFIEDTVKIDDLVNVDITTPTEGDTLVYDSTNSKWVNGSGGGGSGDHITLTQAEYDALVQAGTVDPNAYYFISDEVFPSYAHEYSTNEQIVGTWIDGSTIYEKTITVDNLSGNVYAWTNFAQLAGVDTVIDYSGAATFNDGTQSILGYYVMVSYMNGNLRYFCKEITSLTFSLRLTVRYIKATS